MMRKQFSVHIKLYQEQGKHAGCVEKQCLVEKQIRLLEDSLQGSSPLLLAKLEEMQVLRCCPPFVCMYVCMYICISVPVNPRHLDCAIARCSPQALTITKRSTWPPSATKLLNTSLHCCTLGSNCC